MDQSNNSPEMRTETVFDAGWYEYQEADAPPLNADEFIVWLRNKLDTIPAQYRHSAEVITVQEPLDGPCLGAFKVIYSRPETEEEMKVRMKQHVSWEARYTTARLEKMRHMCRQLGYRMEKEP